MTVNENQEMYSVAYSPDGTRVALGLQNGAVSVWDPLRGRRTLYLPGHAGAVLSVAYSADGKRIVSASADGTVKVWDAEDTRITELQQRLLWTGGAHRSPVFSASFSPNGRSVVSAGEDQTFRLWDAATGEEIARFIDFVSDEWACLTPDNYYTASPLAGSHLRAYNRQRIETIDSYTSFFNQPFIVADRLTGTFSRNR
jgi:WD40 repeat protein